jgi:hypothetical protein
VTVEIDGDNLTIRQGSGLKRRLLPESDLTFFINENHRSSYTFVKDTKGAVTELVVQMDGREIWRAKKTN